jgi:hypothetical protein
MSGFGPGAYTVTPSKADENYLAPNGIFSNDASLIAQHVVNVIMLTPTQQKAARVSGMADISSFDAGLVARWIVGLDDAINQTGEWKFTPINRVYPDVNADLSMQDYDALLMGDVNGDWIAPVMRGEQSAERREPTKDAVIVSMPNVRAVSKSDISVPFRIDNLAGKNVSSYQFDLEYDPAVITPVQQAVVINGTLSEHLSAAFNSPMPGLLKVAVYGAIPASGDGVYVNLRFTVIGSVGSSSPLTISGFRFNDGSTDAVAADGQLSVFQRPDTSILSGRVLTGTGRAVIGAKVSITSTNGTSQSVVSDQFGFFEFDNLTLGEMYNVGVQSKDFRFYPTSVSIIDNLTDLNMIAVQ